MDFFSAMLTNIAFFLNIGRFFYISVGKKVILKKLRLMITHISTPPYFL